MRPIFRGPRRLGLACLAGLLTLTPALARAQAGGPRPGAAPPVTQVPLTPTPAAPASGAPTAELSGAVRRAAEAVIPAVVTVRTPTSAGSGLVVDANGQVLTTDRLVSGSGAIQIVLPDGRALPVTAISRDPDRDLAVLKVDATGLSAVPLGTPKAARAGDVVMGIGRRAGGDVTIAVGTITSGATAPGPGRAGGLIQTDLATVAEASGGPLVSARGEVLGVATTAPRTGGGASAGLAAVPIDRARPLLRPGRVAEAGRPLGLSLQPLTPELARSFGVRETRGLVVAAVERESPAERGGLRPGDVIVTVDGQAVGTVEELGARLAGVPSGRTVELQVVRDGTPRPVRVAVAGSPPAREAGGSVGLAARYGLEVRQLTPELARRLGVQSERGVVVTEVRADSPAARAGLTPGDLIREVNRVPVETVPDVERGAARAGGGGAAEELLLRVEREGAARYVVMRAG